MSARFELVPRRDISPDLWDAFVDAADEAWLWHRYDFQDAMATWPRSEDSGFAVLDRSNGHRIAAVVPLRRGNRGHERLANFFFLESLGGPACSLELSSKDRKFLLVAIRERVLAIAQRGICLETRFMLPPLAPSYRGAYCPRINPLLHVGCSNDLSQTWVIGLGEELSEVRRRYSELTRRELRKAARSGYRVREAVGKSDCDAYFQLHCETYARTGARPHPKRYFEYIFEKFVPRGLARIVFLERDGLLLAAQNTAIYKSGAQYWTGASISEKSGGENRLLFDDQIEFARNRAGCEWYEVGEAFPQAAGGKNKGLNDFKKSFGGEMYPFYKGRLPVGGLPSRVYRALGAYRQ